MAAKGRDTMNPGRGARRTAGVLFGIGAVVAITWIRLALSPLAGTDMALVLYVLAVLLAAGIGGAIAGIATTLLALVAGVGLVIGPNSFAAARSEWLRVVIFVIEGVAISLTMELLHRRTNALNQTAHELDEERRHVERMALEDEMTGLGNRRAFERALETAQAQSMRGGSALTLAFADIDGLKRINDGQGHARGDALLVVVASAIRQCCRASDQAFRVGGDEFAMLLPGTDREEYEAFKLRLEALVEEVGARFDGSGVSIGGAHSPADSTDVQELLRLADSRMYIAKSDRHDARSRPTEGSA